MLMMFFFESKEAEQERLDREYHRHRRLAAERARHQRIRYLEQSKQGAVPGLVNGGKHEEVLVKKHEPPRSTGSSSNGVTSATAAKVIHSVFAYSLLFRVVFLDGAFLALPFLPRNVVVWFVEFVVSRLITLYLPKFAHHWLDSEVTPALLLVAWSSLWLTDGLRREFLWPEKGESRNPSTQRFKTLVLFVFTPVLLLFKLYLFIYVNNALPETHFHGEGFKNLTREFYDFTHHLTNEYGGGDILTPNMTLVYKTVSPHNITACDFVGFEGIISLLPDDFGIKRNRAQLEKGILELDIYEPRVKKYDENGNPMLAPVVVFIHGGGWVGGCRSFLVFYRGGLPRHILNEGYLLVAISYRLTCHGVNGLEMLSDVQDALQFVTGHAHEWGGDGSQIVLWGTSAGGNLALLAAYSFGMPQIKAVANFYGVVELRETDLLVREVETGSYFDYFYSRAFVAFSRHVCDHADHHECFAAMSPLHHIRSDSPPTFTLHGREDPLVSVNQAHWLHEELKKHNVDHALVTPYASSHNCDYLVSSACAQAAIKGVDHLLKAYTSFTPATP